MKNLCFISLISIFHTALTAAHSLLSRAWCQTWCFLRHSCQSACVRALVEPLSPVPIWAAAVLWGPLPSGAEWESALLAVPSEAAPLGTFFSHDFIVTAAWGQSGLSIWPPARSLSPGFVPLCRIWQLSLLLCHLLPMPTCGTWKPSCWQGSSHSSSGLKSLLGRGLDSC